MIPLKCYCLNGIQYCSVDFVRPKTSVGDLVAHLYQARLFPTLNTMKHIGTITKLRVENSTKQLFHLQHLLGQSFVKIPGIIITPEAKNSSSGAVLFAPGVTSDCLTPRDEVCLIAMVTI